MQPHIITYNTRTQYKKLPDATLAHHGNTHQTSLSAITTIQRLILFIFVSFFKFPSNLKIIIATTCYFCFCVYYIICEVFVHVIYEFHNFTHYFLINFDKLFMLIIYTSKLSHNLAMVLISILTMLSFNRNSHSNCTYTI